MNFSHLLVRLGLADSRSEARRLITQGAVEVDSEIAKANSVSLRNGMIIRVGKHRFLRIVDADKQ
jgi:tyrosyl-tRNA synthetase